jgi:hypothetical protein
MVCSKVMVRITIGHIKVVFGNSLLQKALILPHNIDLMHQERNVVESIMSMCLDVTGFMKANMNARKDLAALCDRSLLEAKPNAWGKLRRTKAPYYLKPIERKEVLRWLKTLKFPDRYAANIK